MTTAVATTKQEAALARTDTIRKAMVDRLPAILPNGMSAARFEAVTLQAIAKNPDLANADPTSIVLAVLEAAQLGLEPTGSLSRAWLVAYKSKDHPKPQAQLMIGYQGLADLARRSGEVSKMWSRVVYEGEPFEVQYGTDDRILHTPTFQTSDPTKIVAAYACALLKDGSVMFDVMTKAEIDAIRARSRSANRGPWVSDYAEMSRKTVTRRLAKSLPLTVEVMDAIEQDTEREYGPSDAAQLPSRTAEVRALLASRQNGPRAPETAPDAPEASDAPVESTAEQTDAHEPVETVEGETVAVCGTREVPVKGDVLICDLPEGHDGSHSTADGKKWAPK